MSSPPVDPWSAQPEHGPPHAPRPQPYGGPPTPPPGDFPTAPYPTTPAPQAGGWPQGGHPADPYPTQAYGGYPPAPHADPYPAPVSGGYPPPQQGFPDATQAYPGFQIPPFGVPATPPPAPQPTKSRLPLILSLGLAGLLVLCLGGGGLVFAALSGNDDPDRVATGRPSASRGATPTATAEPTPSEEDEALTEVRLVTPKTLGSRPKSTEPELRRIAAQMVRDMKSSVRNETGAVGAFYGTAAKRNLVMMAGASGPVLFPDKELDNAIKGLTATLTAKKMTTISPGPLGGVAKCGEGKAAGIALGICVWADHGSVGMIIMYFSSARKAKAEFVTIRGQIEKRA